MTFIQPAFFLRLSVLILFITGFSLLPDPDRPELEIYFQDFHSEQITKVTSHPDGNWFFTADKSGKILMWNTNDYSVFKTITEGNGIPVKSMRVEPGGNRLWASHSFFIRDQPNQIRERWRYLAGSSTDTLFIYPIHDNNTEPVKIAGTYDILGYTGDSEMLFSYYSQGATGIIGLKEGDTDTPFLVYESNETTGQAALNKGQSTLAYSTFSIDDGHELVFLSAESLSEVYRHFYGDEEILDLRYKDDGKNLFVVSYAEESSELYFRTFDGESFQILNEFSESYPVKPLKIQISIETQLQIAVYHDWRSSKLFTLSDNEIQSQGFKSADGSEFAYYNGTFTRDGSQHVLFIGGVFQNVSSFHVYDTLLDGFIKRFEKLPPPVLEVFYLPGDHWVVKAPVPNEILKFYPSGSLMNRFNTGSIEQYLQRNYNINMVTSYTPFVDRNSGIMVFAGYTDNRAEWYTYNLILNEKPENTGLRADGKSMISYSHASRTMLLSEMSEEADFTLFSDRGLHTFEGKHTQGYLSHDGSKVLLIKRIPDDDRKHEISIFSAIDGSLIHNEIISVNGYIKASAVDAQNFWVSYPYFSNQSFFHETRLFSFDGEEIEVEVIEGLPLVDVTSVPGKTAMAVDNFGIIFDDERQIPIRGSSKPVSISLNESGNRLMASMNDGTVRIYNTETLEETARMLHPDQRSQFMISSNGYYTSNTDVREWLAVKQGDNSLPVEFAGRFNRPDKVLESFDINNPQYLNLLERSVQIRMQRAAASLPELSAVSVPVIFDILIDGERTNRTTENDAISISFKVYDELFDIQHVDISLNGVTIRRSAGFGTTGDTIRVNESIPLIPGQNIIHLRAMNSSGGSSVRYERIVERRVDKKPDLYLLSIGVSEYENPEFNLTFADKDAMDMAILFGDSSTVDLQQYMNTFYGKEFRVHGENLPDNLKPIRHYGGSYHSDGTFFQIDSKGYFWLERTYREAGDYLWDFKNGIRRPVTLPNIADSRWDFDQNSVITDPDNRYIIYVDTTNALIYYDTETDQHKSYSLDPFTFKTIIPYGENKLKGQFSYDLRGGDFGVNPIMMLDLSGDFIVYDELPYELSSGQELLALSPDRKNILISEYGDLFLLYEEDPDLQRRIPGLSAGYNQIYSFHPNLPVISTLDSNYNSETQTTEWTQYSYNLQERKADSIRVNMHRNELLGVNIKSGKINWIESENPIAPLTIFDENNISSLAKLSPESFENVYIKTIVNKEATRNTMINELNSFFEQAGEDDQVVVFLAGHGLLGDDYTYYFAPHDMQFAETSANGVSYDEILSALSNTRSTRRLLLMDTCHAGEVFQIEQVQSGDSRYESDVSRSLIVNQQAMFLDSPADVITQLFNQTGSASGITVLSASGGAEVAYESTECAELTNGAFTAALIGYIKEKFSLFGTIIDEDKVRPLLLEDSFMDYISNEVLRTTCNRQIPNSREINPLSTVWLW